MVWCKEMRGEAIGKSSKVKAICFWEKPEVETSKQNKNKSRNLIKNYLSKWLGNLNLLYPIYSGKGGGIL